MKHFNFKIITALLLVIVICFSAYLFIQHKNKQLIGYYKLSWKDYAQPIHLETTGEEFYPENEVGLSLDWSKHYIIAYSTCFIGDQYLSNYLSAGNYTINGQKLILTDQWNQTRIELLKCPNSFMVLKGYRYLIGHSFVKDMSKLSGHDIKDFICEYDWFFHIPTNPIRLKYSSISKVSRKNLTGSRNIQPGVYHGTSECGFEYLYLNENHTFIYKNIEYLCSYLFLKGGWKQERNLLILTDTLVNNSYFLEYIRDTLKGGFNIPGSSEVGGKNPYSQSFVLKK